MILKIIRKVLDKVQLIQSLAMNGPERKKGLLPSLLCPPHLCYISNVMLLLWNKNILHMI